MDPVARMNFIVDVMNRKYGLQELLRAAQDPSLTPLQRNTAIMGIVVTDSATSKDVPELLRIARNPAIDESPVVQAIACIGPGVAGQLIDLLGSQDARLVSIAVQSLGQLGAHASAALPELKKLQAQSRRKGLSAIFGQSKLYKMLTATIRRIEKREGPGGLVQLARTGLGHEPKGWR